MKKFLFCVISGYALVFIFFIEFPQIGGEKSPSGFIAKPIQPPQTTGSHAQVQDTILGAPQDRLPHSVVSTNTQPKPEDEIKTNQHGSGAIETFYRNGLLSSEWAVDMDGNGRLRTYLENGRPWMDLSFAQGQLHGEIKFFYAEGPLSAREVYHSDKNNADIFWYYKNAKEWLELFWHADGHWQFKQLYSENGQPAVLPALNNSQATGYFKAFDAEGKEVVHWQQAGAEQASLLTSYYESGAKSAQLSLKDKKLSGRLLRYGSSGQVLLEVVFTEEGRFKERSFYDENEVLRLKQEMLGAEQVRWEWTAYYPDGNVFWTLTSELKHGNDRMFFLTTHWQDDKNAGANQERVLLG